VGPSADRTVLPTRPSTGAGSDDPVPVEHEGVRAVLIQRSDGTCVLYGRGWEDEWTSVEGAWSAVESTAPRLEWRETTPGVWVAGADGDRSSPAGRQTGRARRSEGAATKRASSDADTYMAAQVIRGITRTGQSPKRAARRSSP
jgi:hypothetical protein